MKKNFLQSKKRARIFGSRFANRPLGFYGRFLWMMGLKLVSKAPLETNAGNDIPALSGVQLHYPEDFQGIDTCEPDPAIHNDSL